MLRFFNKRLHNRKGFTLIELIVVIAILAILALIAIPRLSAFTKTAKIQADASSAELIEKTILTGIASQKIAVVNAKAFTWAGTSVGGGAGTEAQWVTDHLDGGLKAPQASGTVTFTLDGVGNVTIAGLATE